MLCKKCGHEINNDALICENCGEAIEKTPKKSKKLLFGIIALVAVIVAAVAVILNFSLISGAVIKTFGSEDDYFQYVETKTFGVYSDAVSEYYSDVIDNASGGTAAQGEFKINLGDELIVLVEDSLSPDPTQKIELDFLKNLAFDVRTNYNGKLAYTDMAFKIGDKAVLNADLFIDQKNQEGLVALKNLSDKYLKLPLTYDEEGSALNDVGGYLCDQEFLALLPSKEELNKMLDRYVGVMLDNIDGATKSSETLKIGEAEQKVTALEIKLSEKETVAIVDALLKEARADEELKKYIEDVAGYLEAKGSIDNAGEVYNDFIESIDKTIEEITDGEFSEEETLVITEYVNSRHQVIGRKIVSEEELVFSSAIIFEGNTFKAEIIGSDEFKLSGSGEIQKNSVNGEFTLSVEDEEMCKFVIESLEFTEEKLIGKIKAVPTLKLLEKMGLDSTEGALISLTNPALEITFESGEKEGSFGARIVNGEKLFVGFQISTKIEEASEITLPADSNVTSDENVWAESLDFSKLIDSLKDAGVPDTITQALEYLLMSAYDGYYI